MCEEALSSVRVVNKILCLFNQNQTVVLHHLNTTCVSSWKAKPSRWVRTELMMLISYFFLAFPSSCGKFGKKSDAPHAWWAVGRADFKAFLAIFALRRTCQSVTDDAINIQHVCLCATVATEPCIIGKNVFRRIRPQEKAECVKAGRSGAVFGATFWEFQGIFCHKVDLKHQKHIRQIQFSLHLFHIYTSEVFADLNALKHPKPNDLLVQSEAKFPSLPLQFRTLSSILLF